MKMRKINLTRTAIRSLKPEFTTYEVIDSDTRGLRIRVTNKGTKTYTWAKFIGGKFRRASIGRIGEMDLRDARKRANQLNVEADKGQDPTIQMKAERVVAIVTFEDAWIQMIASMKGKRSPATTSQYESIYRTHLSDPIGHRPVGSITAALVEGIHAGLGADHARLANMAVKLTRQTFTWLRKRKIYTGDDPAAHVEMFPERTRRRFLSEDEMRRFWSALDIERIEYPAAADACAMILLTSQRQTAVLGATWDEISQDGSIWTIEARQGTKKRAHDDTAHRKTLPAAAIEIIRRRRRENESLENPSPWVFPSRRGDGRLKSVRYSLDRITTRAKIDDLTSHDLRRTGPSWLASQGKSMKEIAAVLGNKDLGVVARTYAQLTPNAAEAIDMESGAILNAARDSKPNLKITRHAG